MNPINIGLIGYGFSGKTLHAPLIRAVPGLNLRAIVSSDVAKVRGDIPDVAVVSSPAEMISDDNIELIVIATPNESHAPLARAALKAGKHVVIDKPFTLDVAEARDLIVIADRHERLLSVFHNRRWDSDYLAAKFAVQSGALGRVTHFESHFDRYRPKVRERWREGTGPGGGIWFDLSPHMIDQAVELFGLPEWVQANFSFERSGAQAVDWAHAVLSYPDHRIILHASMLVAGGSARFLVHGDKGSLAKHGMDQQEAQALAGMVPGAPGWGVDPDPILIYDGTGECRKVPAPAGDYRRYYIGIREALHAKAPNIVPPIQALAVTAIIEAAIQSAASGSRLAVCLTNSERTDFIISQGRDMPAQPF